MSSFARVMSAGGQVVFGVRPSSDSNPRHKPSEMRCKEQTHLIMSIVELGHRPQSQTYWVQIPALMLLCVCVCVCVSVSVSVSVSVCLCISCLVVAWLFATLTKDYSPPVFSVHGILQARVLEWVACSSTGDLPDSGIIFQSPALQEDSLLIEPLCIAVGNSFNLPIGQFPNE